MAELIHLADELLLQIFSNLASLPLANLELPVLQLNHTPLDRWTDTLTSHTVNTRKFNDQTRVLAHTCKRLHGLLLPALYNHLSLISQERGPRFDRLSNGLWANRDHAAHIKTVHIGNASIKDLYFIFFLPGIHTVSVQGFLPPKNADDQKFNPFRRPGTSPVQALKEFNYGVMDSAWKHFGFEDSTSDLFSCASVRQALSSQKQSLQTFVFTQFHQQRSTPTSSDGLIDLHDFDKLVNIRSVRWRHYSCSTRLTAIKPGESRDLVRGANWRFHDYIPRCPTGHFQAEVGRSSWLKRFAVVSEENTERWGWGWRDTVPGNVTPGPGWWPPTLSGSRLREGNVTYIVYQGEDRKCREVVEGGIDFNGGFNV